MATAKEEGGRERAPAVRRRLARLAWLLDASFRVPGTGVRFGWDALIGLIPGVGDAATGLLAAWIVAEAARLGAPGSVLARMLGNVGLDLLVGAVPLLGDLFDAGFKANQRNVRLLESWLERPDAVARSSRLRVGLVAATVVAFLAGLGALVWWLARLVTGALS